MRRIVLTLSAATLLAGATALHAAKFVVKPGAPNQVVFTSKATAETFQGKTDQLQGWISLDPAQLADSVAVRIEVDVASLKTGIGKRDKDMREDYLETKEFPKAIFEGASLKNAGATALSPGVPAKLEVEGAFTLHGVTRRLRTTVDVTLKDDRTLEFKTEFPVTLQDYKIERPKFLFLKLAEVQQVAVTGTATVAP
jgi:polyisoprenoid-binding protein YceI